MVPCFGVELSPKSLRKPNQRIENSSTAPGHLQAEQVPGKVASSLNNTGSWKIYKYLAAKEHSHVLLMNLIMKIAWYNSKLKVQKSLISAIPCWTERTGEHSSRETTQEETFDKQGSKV